ncbi:MAG: M28 family peptidase [Bdellovibrionales bacterium]|nr:M28 family peptidase [Bdellovibrionales bacterium]
MVGFILMLIKKTVRIFTLLIITFFLIGILLRNPIFVFSKNENLNSISSPDLLKKHVQHIVNVSPFRNYANSDSLDKVAEYIKMEFEKNCAAVSFQNYEVDGKMYKNVICSFGGQYRKKIIIGAHYDVAADQDGADDNASGVAGIIELTRIIKENNIQPAHDLEIVAYTLEEPPYFSGLNMGSYIHAKSLNDKNDSIAFMLSVEMIGYYSDKWWSQNYPSQILYAFYPLKGNFIALIGGIKEYWNSRKLKTSLAQSMNTPLYGLNAPDIVPGIDFSDHRNYWKFGYNAYMITDTSFYRNSNYHKATDTIDTLNYEIMADIVQGLHGLAISKY